MEFFCGLVSDCIFYLFNEKMLRSGYLYIAVLISIIIFSPIFFLEPRNHSSLILFTATGLDLFGKHLDVDSFLQQLFGSIFYNNPVNIILYIHFPGCDREKKLLMPSRYLRLYLLLALPLIHRFVSNVTF